MNVMVYGKTTGEYDWIPDRAIGPTDEQLYAAEMDFNDQEVGQILGKLLADISAMDTSEKRKILINFRKAQLRQLIQVYYQERGWTNSGIPKIETLKKIGLWDFLKEETKDRVSEIIGH